MLLPLVIAFFTTPKMETIYLQNLNKKHSSLVGIEPTTFGLEVQRAILCAKETVEKR
jgi:hypothetical protein